MSTGVTRPWANNRGSCHIDIFLALELSAFVFAPWRLDNPELPDSAVAMRLIDLLRNDNVLARDADRDSFWLHHMAWSNVRQHAGRFGRMDDVDAHLITMTDLKSSNDVSPLLRDRCLVTQAEMSCTATNCSYTNTVNQAVHAVLLADAWLDANGTLHYIDRVAEGVDRYLYQKSGFLSRCPMCLRPDTVLTDKKYDAIQLPALLIVTLPSTGRLANKNPTPVLEMSLDWVYSLVGVGMCKPHSHYVCNILSEGEWLHYDDVPRKGVLKMVKCKGKPMEGLDANFLPRDYGRRVLYYSLQRTPTTGFIPLIPAYCLPYSNEEGGASEQIDLTE